MSYKRPKDINIELFELRYAVVLMECCNFSRAAEKLFITQPSLSQQINRLERKLGFSVFERNSKHVIPTDVGSQFLQSAVKVIKEYEQLQNEVHGIQGMLARKIRFGSSPFNSSIISECIPHFLSKFPNVDLNVMETHDPNLIEMVYKNEIDMALVALPKNHMYREKLQIFPIQEEYVCAVLSKDHPLAAQETIALEALIPNKLIFSSIRTGLKQMVFDAFESIGCSPQEPYEITSAEARLPYIMKGAIAFSLSGHNSWTSNDSITRIPISPRICSTISLIRLNCKYKTPEIEELKNIMLQKATNHFRSQSDAKGDFNSQRNYYKDAPRNP